MVGSFPSPNKAGKARAAAQLRLRNPCAKRRSGSGVLCDFLRGAPDFFTRGGPVAVSHAHPKANLAVAKERSAKEGLCKEARTKQRTLCCGMLLKKTSNKQNMVPVLS